MPRIENALDSKNIDPKLINYMLLAFGVGIVLLFLASLCGTPNPNNINPTPTLEVFRNFSQFELETLINLLKMGTLQPI